jgi:hypothetical protein
MAGPGPSSTALAVVPQNPELQDTALRKFEALRAGRSAGGMNEADYKAKWVGYLTQLDRMGVMKA